MVRTNKKFYRSSKDRISNLPDHIVHQILSFLNVEEVIPLCLVSKRLRDLCISIPFLNVNGIPLRYEKAERVNYINSVDRFFALRKGMEMKRISIRWPFVTANVEERFRIITWLYNATGCEVEFLDLEIIPKKEDVFWVPRQVFYCTALRELRLNLRGCVLDGFPTSGGFCNLKSLSLQDLKIKNDTFGEWISSSCKHLKELRIERVSGIKNISINSCSLQRLKILANNTDICNISISAAMLIHLLLSWKAVSSSGTSLKVFAPNLSNLRWDGYLVDCYSLESMKHIKASAIYLTPDPHLDRNWVSTSQDLSGLLETICISTHLYLHYKSNQIMFKQGCLPSLFLNLRCLHLYTMHLNDDLVPGIACFLKGTPYLETLVVTYHSDICYEHIEESETYGFKIRYWESQCLNFVNKLKTAKIECFREGVNELELIKYLLKHGRALQNMTIIYSHSLKLQEIETHLDDFRKASKAGIVFCPSPE